MNNTDCEIQDFVANCGFGIILFNDIHILQLRTETVAVCGRINIVLDDSQMIPGTNAAEISLHLSYSWGKLQKNLSRKLARPEIEPEIAGWEESTLFILFSKY